MSYENVIIYSGYYHSNNLTNILTKYYNFTNVYEIGNTRDIEKKNNIKINNCLNVDKRIFN
jgi:hypothetical protein